MLQPQSDEEIRPVIEGLRRLDPLLDLRWNPKALLVQRPQFDVMGRATIPAKYEARWQVIRSDTPGLRDDRQTVVICTVTAPDFSGKYPIMDDHGPYAPVGEWLVSYMALWDRAQSAWQDAMEHHWKEHERAEQWLRIDETEGNQDASERIYREFAGEYWMGGAQGKTANASWLGTSHVAQAQDALRAADRALAKH